MRYWFVATLKELDKKDRRILSELDRNCRQSNAEIARKLKLGKHAVSYRTAQLEKKGTIKNYYTVIDMSCLGWQSYRIYLKLFPMEETDRKTLISYLAESELTWWVGEMDGEWDVGFVVWVPGHYEFERFWKAFSEKFQPFVEKNRVSVYLRFNSYSYGFLSGNTEGRKQFITGVGGKKKVDGKDLKILRAIADRARMGTVEIAKASGLSPVQVAYRIKKLTESGVIKGFRANIQFDDLTLYKADFQLKSPQGKKSMFAFALNEKWAMSVDESIGFADFELEVLCPTYQEFKGVIERFKAKFFREIRSCRFGIYSSVAKIKYF